MARRLPVTYSNIPKEQIAYWRHLLEGQKRIIPRIAWATARAKLSVIEFEAILDELERLREAAQVVDDNAPIPSLSNVVEIGDRRPRRPPR